MPKRKARTRKIPITAAIEPALIDGLDDLAEKTQGMTRSAHICEAVREYLARHDENTFVAEALTSHLP